MARRKLQNTIKRAAGTTAEVAKGVGRIAQAVADVGRGGATRRRKK